MKKLIFTLSLFLSAFITNAQQNCFWHENFDAPSLDDSVTSYSSNIATNAGWSINSRLQVSPANCDSAYVTLGDTVILTTNSIDLTGMTFVLLDFDQICKVSFFDVAIIEISPDGGNTWLQLTETEYLTPIVNPPGAPFGAQGNQFSSASYAIWQPTMDSVVPDNSWWQHETFDISNFAGTFSDVKIRFVLYDSNIPGGAGNNGWKIDNICVTAAPCELTPPVLTQLPIIWQNTVYNLGPYTVNVDATDNTGVDSVWLYYQVNGSLPFDSLLMTNSTGTTWTGQIPAVNDSDTVCYYFVGYDASACNNSTTYPVTGCIQFIASSGITYPYCDNFDVQNLWADSTIAPGSIWELGTPAFGFTTGAHSAPNAWDINLATGYLDNADAVLYSPIFNAPIINAKFDFWHKFDTEQNWDGTRVEYSTDGGTVWAVLGDAANSCGCQTNWYNLPVINSSGLPGWSGNSGIVFPGAANGWVKSEYVFTSTFPFGPSLQFRFIFTSDAIITGDGYSIDDLCITLPQPEDVGVAIINQPSGNAPAGNCLPVIVTLQNFGINPQTSFDVYYSIDGTVFGPFLWTGNLAPGATITDTMPCFNVTAGTVNVCSWTSLVADGNHFNDTICSSVIGVPTIVLNQTSPYCDSFDSGNIGWFNQNNGGGTGSVWELGVPAFGTTNTAFSAPNAWDINLTTGYNFNADVALYTPYFDISAAINPYLSFYVNFNTEQNWDGVRLEYSLDGQPWTLLNPPTGTTNWYNMPTIFSSGLPAWAGNTQPGPFQALLNPTATGWCHVEATDLSVLGAGTGTTFVQFRFVFTSDASVQIDGFSIDAFCFAMPAPFDAGVPQIIQPGGSGPAGNCLPVIVDLKNFGTNTLTAFDVYYRVDTLGGSTTYGPFPWTGNLAPGQTDTETFPCFTVPTGAFTLCSWTVLVADGNNFNDTSCTNSVGIPVLSLTTCDDLESGNLGYTTLSQAGLNLWELGTPAFGQTTGAHSGISAWDVNLAATYANNDSCTLITPIYDVATAVNPSLSFWQNRNITTVDGLRVDYTADGGNSWNILWPGVVPAPAGTAINWFNNANINFSGLPGWTGNSGGGWMKSTYFLDDILAAAGNPNYIQFRFVFTTGFSFPTLDGISIDDICMKQPGPQDAGVVQINTPAPGTILPAGSTSPVEITFLNYGAAPITTCNITWALNGVPQGTSTFSGNLLPGDLSSIITLNGTLTVPAGQFTLCAYTQLIADGDTTNDTTCVDYVGVPVIPLSFTNGYCDDFEGPNAGWTMINSGDPGTIWELGTPAFGVTTGAHSGTQAWDINLSTTYTGNADVALYSPIFDFFTGPANDVILSFWRHHNTETAFDGVRLEYTSNGTAWNLLGTLGAPNPPYVNWYTNTIFANNLPAWAGNSPWIESRMTNLGLVGLNGANTVQFRFVFVSDAIVQIDGFSIDDFCLEVPVPLTASPTSVSTSLSFPCVFEGQNVTFTTTIKNAGTIPMNNVEATLVVDGTTIVTDPVTYSPALAPGASQVHSFSTTWLATIGGNHNVCVYTSNPNGQPDLNPTDDTTCFVVQVCDTIGISSTAPYCNDFEGGTPWYTFNALTYTPGTSWQLGTPAKATLNAAHSGTNAWITGLSANYPNQDTSGLFTPAFNVVGGEKYNLSFWHQFDTELFQDGGTVEYSTDYGATWTLLGNAGQGPQWYSSFFITALGGIPPAPGWSGFLPAYQFAQHEICFNQNSTVMFRFRFMSDFTVNHEGWVIDDVCFGDMNIVCPVGVQELVADNTLSLGQNYPNPVNGTTTIEYIIPENGNVQLSLVNMMGQMVDVMVQENENAGKHYVTFDTRDLAPGIYYYELVFNHERLVKKMVVTQ